MATNLKPQSQELVGQIAIVTGGGRGFGREIARALAQAGAEVAVVARSDDQLSETETLRSAQSDMERNCIQTPGIEFVPSPLKIHNQLRRKQRMAGLTIWHDQELDLLNLGRIYEDP
jgi:NAD(P)-dependent dehydrogenase (short-subunit alcohol dehydrogenase family)